MSNDSNVPKVFSLVPRYEQHGIRRGVYGSYLIFYHVEDEQVVIVHALHDGVLAFNRSDTITFSGNISGGVAVRQIGRYDDPDGRQHLRRWHVAFGRLPIGIERFQSRGCLRRANV